MNEKATEKRIVFRRYEDRRISMMLSVHEILFEYPPGKERNKLILSAVAENYQVDRAAMLAIREYGNAFIGEAEAMWGNWKEDYGTLSIAGEGFDRIVELHETAEGALTFESVRKPEAFSDNAWRNLWSHGSGSAARALLSMSLGKGSRKLIWLQQTGSTREWSSRDRDLIEEISALLQKAAARGM